MEHPSRSGVRQEIDVAWANETSCLTLFLLKWACFVFLFSSLIVINLFLFFYFTKADFKIILKLYCILCYDFIISFNIRSWNKQETKGYGLMYCVCVSILTGKNAMWLSCCELVPPGKRELQLRIFLHGIGLWACLCCNLKVEWKEVMPYSKTHIESLLEEETEGS